MATARKAPKQRATASPRRELPTDDDAMLTKEEVAKLLGVNLRWVERHVGHRTFPVHHMGKLVRIRRGDVLAYLDKQRTEAAS